MASSRRRLGLALQKILPLAKDKDINIFTMYDEFFSLLLSIIEFSFCFGDDSGVCLSYIQCKVLNGWPKVR